MLITLIAAAAIAAAPGASETPAIRNASVAPPNYPAACMPAPGVEAKPERVTLAYSVNADGQAVDIRVRESTNECFNGPAIDAARLWRFEPRRVNGVAVRQDDFETTLTFVVSENTMLDDMDARPILRVPPDYPERCYGSASTRDIVRIEFDISETGTPTGAHVIESTNACFNKAALASIESWRYAPKVQDGKFVARPSVRTYFIFDRPSGVGASRKQPDLIRPALGLRFKKVRSALQKPEVDHASIVAELDAIESEFGSDFRPVEMASFYPLRGAARIEAKNYRGALDDLRIAARITVDKTAGEAILRTIEQLEAYIAAEDAALAAGTAKSE